MVTTAAITRVPSKWRHLRYRFGGTRDWTQVENAWSSLNRQRYDREGNACKERTHAKKH